MFQRKRRPQQIQRDIAEAENAERNTVAVTATAQESLDGDIQTAATGATANPSPSTRQQSVNSWSERPGDAAFFKDDVQFMASLPREEFSTELGAAVVAKASALLAMVRKTPLHPAQLFSAKRA